MLRLSVLELELPCKALGDEGSLSVLAAVAGRGSPAPMLGWQCCGNAGGLQASQDGRLRRGLQGLHWDAPPP